MSDFEGRWESFRVDREIPCETFVSSGHGFIEDMEEFFKIETKAIQKELEKERQKVAMLKEALEFYTTNNDTPKVAENTLQKLKEME